MNDQEKKLDVYVIQDNERVFIATMTGPKVSYMIDPDDAPGFVKIFAGSRTLFVPLALKPILDMTL